jgi:CrcB protein
LLIHFAESIVNVYIAVFLGGGIGAIARYWLSGAVYRFLPTDFPYGNLCVNIVGCLLIGFVMSLTQDRWMVQPAVRVFFTIGILGGFTTFSSFSYETLALMREGQVLYASVNVLGTVAGCLGATYCGFLLGKWF